MAVRQIAANNFPGIEVSGSSYPIPAIKVCCHTRNGIHHMPAARRLAAVQQWSPIAEDMLPRRLLCLRESSWPRWQSSL